MLDADLENIARAFVGCHLISIRSQVHRKGMILITDCPSEDLAFSDRPPVQVQGDVCRWAFMSKLHGWLVFAEYRYKWSREFRGYSPDRGWAGGRIVCFVYSQVATDQRLRPVMELFMDRRGFCYYADSEYLADQLASLDTGRGSVGANSVGENGGSDRGACSVQAMRLVLVECSELGGSKLPVPISGLGGKALARALKAPNLGIQFDLIFRSMPQCSCQGASVGYADREGTEVLYRSHRGGTVPGSVFMIQSGVAREVRLADRQSVRVNCTTEEGSALQLETFVPVRKVVLRDAAGWTWRLIVATLVHSPNSDGSCGQSVLHAVFSDPCWAAETSEVVPLEVMGGFLVVGHRAGRLDLAIQHEEDEWSLSGCRRHTITAVLSW